MAEVSELNEISEVNVWGERQDVLENQALKELQIFTKETSSKEDTKEETSNSSCPFNLNDYLNKQEELRRKQDYKKSKLLNRSSKAASGTVTQANEEDTESRIKAKRKRKRSENETSGSEYFPSEDDSDGENERLPKMKCYTRKCESIRTGATSRYQDDGCYETYNKRLDEYYKSLEDTPDKSLNDYVTINGGLKVIEKLWGSLYRYQKDGVKWLWNIHQKNMGGLLGDEMGLGKTVQVIAFLHSLSFTQIRSKFGLYVGLGPTLIVAPSTVIHQWVQHFHEWAPEFRVAVLHSSTSFRGDKNDLIKDINDNKDVLVTTYSSILKYREALMNLNWHYLILDEGHKIRNPTAKVTVAVKKIRTLHRLMLTGSPMQNNLQELWCLFDFINPGMLGTLPVFLQHFADPIIKGGYVSATPLQEATALSMARILKEKITSCMLRRSKDVVQKYINLPAKTEQVLFCSMTDEQRDLYKDYLLSDHVQNCLGRTKNNLSQNQIRANVLVGIMQMRKICNHPDLHSIETDTSQEEKTGKKHGDYKRSGKMRVVAALLKIWKKEKHRVLLFTQARGMIQIFQKFLSEEGYKYLKMDGSTTVSSRQGIIDSFNSDTSIDVFLLTTKVGGLGLNLVGANRVIIYDPDWNPATDMQARERAWRIGQERDVTIYRLLSAGTIEEKIYRRQIFKQLLAQKVLVDPTCQKFFRTSDLYDIFSLQEQPDESNMDSTNIFKAQRIAVQKKLEEKRTQKEKMKLPEDKIKAMRELAAKIAKSLSDKSGMDGSTSKREKKSKGQIDGEQVEGLVKVEVKKVSKEERRKQKANQDDYILDKLFSNSGVQMSVHHDSIFTTASGKRKGVSVEYEAKLKADLALQALEKSIYK